MGVAKVWFVFIVFWANNRQNTNISKISYFLPLKSVVLIDLKSVNFNMSTFFSVLLLTWQIKTIRCELVFHGICFYAFV